MTRSMGVTNMKLGIKGLNHYVQGEWETAKGLSFLPNLRDDTNWKVPF